MMKRALGLAVLIAAGFVVVSAQEAPAPTAPARGGRGGGTAGQVVWAPKSVKLHEWVAPPGDDMSCRLAMNGYTDLSHSYEATSGR